jgi:ADP-ribosylglycohydrolase
VKVHHPTDAARRMDRVAVCLDGLSVGDALGERFFGPGALALVASRALPRPFWFYTDDTEMALGIAHVLDLCGHIDQDELAAVFAHRYQRNPRRGYGATAHQILMAIGDGKDWRSAARSAFHGEGSMGNGAAMRVAPVGAYFADDYAETAQQATLSAEVTHAHPEAIAGAIAVAVAAGWAVRFANDDERPGSLLERVLALTPPSRTRDGIERALTLGAEVPVTQAADILGNGSGVIAPDTVPLALWCASRHIDSYEEAIWAMLSAGGDVDTNCAIVGGIVALAVGRQGIPREWLESREDLR